MLTVTEAVVTAFQLAAHDRTEVMQQWIDASWRLGSLLQGSLLSVSIQRVGRLDCVLRCMEDEFFDEKPEVVAMYATDQMLTLAEVWVGGVYEILRLTKASELIASEALKPLAYDFGLLRVPMEKYQIAWDKDLRAPIHFTRDPSDPDAPFNAYVKDDPKRAHIMPTGLSDRGSAQWLAIDLRATPNQRWIERRSLSERVLQMVDGLKS